MENFVLTGIVLTLKSLSMDYVRIFNVNKTKFVCMENA